ncbi:ankyrin 2,3/unc44, partial [Metarhizium majus ARSEF 297]
MASSEPIPATLTVDDIAAFSDSELAEFMKKHRRPNGDFDLPVDGWDKLSKDDRNQLAERLKAQERALAQSPTACSRPLDLDALDARLRDVSDSNNLSARDRPRLRARRTATPPDFEAKSREDEIKAYHDLINDGGRPLYTIDPLQPVFWNPDEHPEIIYPWEHRDRNEIWQRYWIGYIGRFELFQTQLARWQDFRKWQNDNRGIEDDGDGGFPAYLESMKRIREWGMLKDAYVEWLAEIEADPSSVKKDWDFEEFKRDEQRYRCRESGCDGFSQYAEAVKRRLARHNFTRPFYLHEDPKQQDKLTTWIEYLNFECWWLDRHTRAIEHFKPAHDKAWKELVDLKMLRTHETPESVRTDESSMQDQAEEDQAREAVERATSEAERVYTMTQKDPQRLRIPTAKRISMMKAAAIKLNAAKERLQWIKRRNHQITTFVRGTFGYDGAKKDAARQSMLVQWVLEQVLLIEAEMTESETNKARSNATKRMKRRPSTDEDDPGKQGSKRQKSDRQELSSHPASGPASGPAILAEAREAHPESSVVTDQNEAKGSRIKRPTTRRPRRSGEASQATSLGLRRSARIAARQNSPGTALAPDTSRPGLRSRLHAKPTEPLSRPHLSAEDTKNSVTTKRGLKSSSRRGVAKLEGVSKRSQRPQRRRNQRRCVY